MSAAGIYAAKLALGPVLLPQARAVPQPLRWYLVRYSAWLDKAVQRWAQEQLLAFCALRWATDAALISHNGFHPGPLLYPLWTDRLAEMVMQQRDRWAPHP